MTATVSRRDLLAGLTRVKPLPSQTSKEPMFLCVRVGTVGGLVTLESSNDKATTRTAVRAKVSRPGEAAVVTYTSLVKWLTSVRDDRVWFRFAKTHLTVKAGKQQFVLDSLPVSEWATVDDVDGSTVPLAANLRAAILRAGKVASPEECRPVLASVRLDGQHVVASDSYRLVCTGPFRPLPDTLLPVEPLLKSLKTAGDTADLVVNGKRAMVVGADGTSTIFATRDGFPDWRSLSSDWSPAPTATVRFDRQDMVAALRRIESLAGRGSVEPVRLHQNDEKHPQLSVTFRPCDGETVVTRLDFDGRLEGTAAFNPTFLREAIEAVDDPTVCLQGTGDHLKPWRVTAGDIDTLIMPVRVDGRR